VRSCEKCDHPSPFAYGNAPNNHTNSNHTNGVPIRVASPSITNGRMLTRDPSPLEAASTATPVRGSINDVTSAESLQIQLSGVPEQVLANEIGRRLQGVLDCKQLPHVQRVSSGIAIASLSSIRDVEDAMKVAQFTLVGSWVRISRVATATSITATTTAPSIGHRAVDFTVIPTSLTKDQVFAKLAEMAPSLIISTWQWHGQTRTARASFTDSRDVDTLLQLSPIAITSTHRIRALISPQPYTIYITGNDVPGYNQRSADGIARVAQELSHHFGAHITKKISWVPNTPGCMAIELHDIAVANRILAFGTLSLKPLGTVAGGGHAGSAPRNVNFCGRVTTLLLDDIPALTSDSDIAAFFTQQAGWSTSKHEILTITINQDSTGIVCIASAGDCDYSLLERITGSHEISLSEDVYIRIVEDFYPKLLLQPVQDVKDEHIKNLPLFEGQVADIVYRGQTALIWLKSKSVHDRCIQSSHTSRPLLGGVAVTILPFDAQVSQVLHFDHSFYKSLLSKSPSVHLSVEAWPRTHRDFSRRWESKTWVDRFNAKRSIQPKTNGSIPAKSAPSTTRSSATSYSTTSSSYGANQDNKSSHHGGDNKMAPISTGNDERHNIDRHRLQVATMLATLATIRRGSYYCDDGKLVTLPVSWHQSMKTIVWDAKSQWNGPPAPITAIRFPHTSVRVIQRDCFLVANELRTRRENPLFPVMLNMASATTPGGGYRKGDGAQEENLCRRSNLSVSLDTLDDFNTTTIPTYPLAKFGGVYTSGVTVFRGLQEDGYPFLVEPYHVDVVSVAAFRHPPLSSPDRIADKEGHAAGMVKKIEAIFNIALQQGHDSIVLSAFGCGAFKCPSDHVARMFRAVIQQFAGCFSEIHFAIVDDHNSHGIGNFRAFHQVLDGDRVFPPSKGLPSLLPAYPCPVDDKPCNYGGLCKSIITVDHANQFSHPKFCPQGPTCRETCDVHQLCWTHSQPCRHAGQCRDMSDLHRQRFNHPPMCNTRGRCVFTDPQHELDFSHPPVCDDGLTCNRKSDAKHADEYRHIRKECEYGNRCVKWSDEQHWETFDHHDVSPPCPAEPNCKDDNDDHNHRFSHLCEWGGQCHDHSREHNRAFIHVTRLNCRDGVTCTSIDDDHYHTYSHLGIRDLRMECRHGSRCTDISVPHRQKYWHKLASLPACASISVNSSLDFADNRNQSLRRVNRHFDTSSGRITVDDEIIEWIRRLRPVHRCNAKVFKSVIEHRSFMSAEHMQTLKDPEAAVAEVMIDHTIERLANSDAIIKIIEGGVHSLVLIQYEESKKITRTDRQKTRASSDIATAQATLGHHDWHAVEERTKAIAKACILLSEQPTGINYGVDKTLGTWRQLFAIDGAHGGTYYGGVSLVFKQDILLHPDTSITPEAGTTYNSGKAYEHRPWLGPSQTGNASAIACYHGQKMHAGTPDCYTALAAEIVGNIANRKKISPNRVRLNDVQRFWTSVDSHYVFEAHLPALVSIQMIEHFLIPGNIWDAYEQDFKDTLHRLFPNFDQMLIRAPDFVEGSAHVIGEPTIAEFMLKHVPARQPLNRNGFSFTLSAQSNKEVPLPVMFRENTTRYHLYWYARGDGQYAISLSDSADITNTRRDVVSAIITCDRDSPAVLALSPPLVYEALVGRAAADATAALTTTVTGGGRRNNHPQTVVEARSKSFNRGCQLSDYIGYHLCVDVDEGWVTLEHIGYNSLYCHKQVRLTTRLSRHLRYVSATCLRGRVMWRDLQSSATAIDRLHCRNGDVDIKSIKSTQLSVNGTAIPIPGQPTGGNNTNNTNVATGSADKPNIVARVWQFMNGTKVCEYGNVCRHVFGQRQDDIAHMNEHVHPCRFGGGCRDQKDSQHTKHYTHIALPMCPSFTSTSSSSSSTGPTVNTTSTNDGTPNYNNTSSTSTGGCALLNDSAHRERYHHPGWPDFLIPCRDGLRCVNRNVDDHNRRYKHMATEMSSSGSSSSSAPSSSPNTSSTTNRNGVSRTAGGSSSWTNSRGQATPSSSSSSSPSLRRRRQTSQSPPRVRSSHHTATPTRAPTGTTSPSSSTTSRHTIPVSPATTSGHTGTARVIPSQTPCRHGARCWDAQCKYQHPTNRVPTR
jgi:uncharacterized protein (TIGR02452 family)